MPRQLTSARRSKRTDGSQPAGVTLLELLVALTIATVLGGIVWRALDRQQRFYDGTALMVEQRSQLRQGMGVLPTELRSLSSSDGDLLALADSAIDYRGHIGSAVACAAGGSTIELPPVNVASGARLLALAQPIQAGDVAFIFDQGPDPSATDDAWRTFVVAAVGTTSTPCSGSPLLDSIADAGKSGTRLTLVPALSPTILPGAPVRFARRARFALYRSAAEWYLGWTEWNDVTGSFNIIQPVAGPFRGYAAAGSGIQLSYFDSTAARLTSLAGAGPDVARVALTSRGLTSRSVRMDGLARAAYAESLATQVAIRNRR